MTLDMMSISWWKYLNFSKHFRYIYFKNHTRSQVKSSWERTLDKKIFVPIFASVLTVGVCECRGGCNSCNNSKNSGASCGECDKSDRACKCTTAVPNPAANVAAYTPPTDQKPLKWEKQDLTHCYLLKQANILTADSITRILSEAISAFEDYHCQYRQLLEMLMELMEDGRCATENRQELINCKMIVIRSSIEDIKKNIIELECYLESVTRLAHAAAESAFLANAEYASIALMERLDSTTAKAKEIKDKTLELERASNELHSLIIVESGKGLK